ncbi:MAG: glycosyltransferase family 1 protein, partial [Microcystis aeruginosa Ma_MB_F_20061100_S20]
ERYSIALVEQLAARHEVHVFAQTIAHDFPGVVYHRVPMPLARPRWINQLYFAWKTWRYTRQGFDIVHSHENTWHGNVQTVHVLPVWHTLFIGLDGWRKVLRWIKVCSSPRLLAYLALETARYRPRSNRRIVLTGQLLMPIMQNCFPSAEHIMSVISPGVVNAEGPANYELKTNARKQLGLPRNEWLVLFVGNDMRRKGLPALLKAMDYISNAHLVVLGHGEHIAEFKKFAQSLGNRAHFLGARNDAHIVYQAVDCLVHPSLEDTYAMVVLEAMSHGLPTIVSGKEYCGISLELRDELDAILLNDPQDPLAIADAIHRLSTDEKLRALLSFNAHRYAQTRTWVEVAGAYETIFYMEE